MSSSALDWMARHRKWMHTAIVLLWALLFLLPYLLVGPFGQRTGLLRPFLAVDHIYADELAHLGRCTPPNPDLVFLGIDDASFHLDGLDPATIRQSRPLQLMQHDWPWSREIYADLLDRLIDSGAREVIFDLLLEAQKPDDALLAASLSRHANAVVLGCNFSDTRDQVTFPSATLIPAVLPPDPRLGFVNFWPDFDGVIRRTHFEQPYLGANLGSSQPQEILSIAARAAKIFDPALVLPADESGHLFRYTGPRGSFPTASVYEVFDPDSWHHNFQGGAYFRGKIVMVGPLENFQHDQHETPLGKMDGAEVHLQALNAALHHEYLFYTGDSLGAVGGLIALTSFFAWLIGVLGHRGGGSVYALSALAFILFYLVAGLPLFSTGLILAVAAPLGAFGGGTLSGLGLQYILEQRERARTRRFFERYVSPEVVQEILDNPTGYYESLVGRRREVTVLFSDLRGFTSMTEQADSEQLVRELNEYLQEMTRALFQHKGILDKFIGDAVMAVWGSFHPHPAEDTKNAVRAALAMIEALAGLNARRAAEGKKALAMGIGIHHGEAVVGDIGAEEQKNFTVIGDTVNLASRLEGVTKEYGVELIISDAVAQLVRDDFYLQTVDFVRVKGRSQAVRIFTVLGVKEKALTAERLAALARYEEGLSAYRARDFVQARAHFSQADDDGLARLFLNRCREYEQNPPPEDWDGSYIMTRK